MQYSVNLPHCFNVFWKWKPPAPKFSLKDSVFGSFLSHPFIFLTRLFSTSGSQGGLGETLRFYMLVIYKCIRCTLVSKWPEFCTLVWEKNWKKNEGVAALQAAGWTRSRSSCNQVFHTVHLLAGSRRLLRDGSNGSSCDAQTHSGWSEYFLWAR